MLHLLDGVYTHYSTQSVQFSIDLSKFSASKSIFYYKQICAHYAAIRCLREIQHEEIISIYPCLYHCLTEQKTDDFQPLNAHKNRRHPTEVGCRLFVVQSCLTDADFAISSNYCLIGTRVIIPDSSF